MTAPERHFDSPEQEAYLNLWRTYDHLRSLEDVLFSQHDLTAQQYNVLRLLKAAQPDGCATLALGARLVSRAPDITRMLDKLEQRGWLTRLRQPDNRRVVMVNITPAGLKLLRELQTPVTACHQQQLGHLTPEQLQQLIELLRLVRQPHESDASWK